MVFVLIRVESFDVVSSLRSEVIFTEKDILLFDGSQPCIIVGDDAQGA